MAETQEWIHRLYYKTGLEFQLLMFHKPENKMKEKKNPSLVELATSSKDKNLWWGGASKYWKHFILFYFFVTSS